MTNATIIGTYRYYGDHQIPAVLVVCHAIKHQVTAYAIARRNNRPASPHSLPTVYFANLSQFSFHSRAFGKGKKTAATQATFPSAASFNKSFRLEFNWKGPFRFLPTGIFGITSGGGGAISFKNLVTSVSKTQASDLKSSDLKTSDSMHEKSLKLYTQFFRSAPSHAP